jgi:hypothetical protein
MTKFKDLAEQPEVVQDKPIPYREWTALDMLTHDFTNSEFYRNHCLQAFGQFMSTAGYRVIKTKGETP